MTELKIRPPMFKNALRFRVYHEGRIHVDGIDYGPRGLKEVKDLGDGYAIWKTHGHGSWVGVGMGQGYTAPDYFLVYVKESTVKMLAEVQEPGHYWKKAIKLLEDKYENDHKYKGEQIR